MTPQVDIPDCPLPDTLRQVPSHVNSELINPLDLPFWKLIDMGPVKEIVAVPEWETVSRVMTAPCRLGAVIASLTTATNGKVDTEYVATLVVGAATL